MHTNLLRYALQDGGEPGTAVGVPGREVGASDERLQLRSEEYAHGPAAAPLSRLWCRQDVGEQ